MSPGRRGRAAAAATAVGLALVACGTSPTAPLADVPAGTSASATSTSTSVVLAPVEQGPAEDVPSALDSYYADGLPAPVVDTDRIRDGGPPPDGIPPIDAPRFDAVPDAGWLSDDEAVLALDVDGEHRAYPVAIMTWHEIVNDTVGGVPVAVTYCPLCNSALAFDRRVGERLMSFGTSGRLYLSALVMYDRQTRSLWSQVEGRALAGLLAGTTLRQLPVQTVRWASWRDAHPDGHVLSRDTGVERDYGRNPYVGYDAAGNAPFALDQDADPRLPPKERVVAFPDAVGAAPAAGSGATGPRALDDPTAVRLTTLAREGVLELEIAGEPVVLLAAPGLASSLDDARVADGRSIAATGAFSPVLDGRRLQLRRDGDAFLDDATGSRFDVLGRGLSGPLRGRQLSPVVHVDTFWFAWAAFQPGTRLIS